MHNYIVIEGNIGAGKTSLAVKYAAELNARLVLEQFADNPFLPQFYTDRERFAFPLELFFVAERFQQLKDTLSKQDLFQTTIIADYVFIKSLLFAKVNLTEDEFKLYQRLFQIIHSTLPEPDVLVYLHCDVDRLLKNISARGREYEQNISADYLISIKNTYFDYFKTVNTFPVLIINVTNADFVKDESHYNKIKKWINTPHKIGMHFYDF